MKDFEQYYVKSRLYKIFNLKKYLKHVVNNNRFKEQILKNRKKNFRKLFSRNHQTPRVKITDKIILHESANTVNC